jgi:hypothetical protein
MSYIIKSLKHVLKHTKHAKKHLFCILWITFEIHNNTFSDVSESIKAFRVWKRATHIINGANKYESCKQILKDCAVLTMTSLCILEELCYINSYKGNLKQNITIHGHNTRSKLNFHVQLCSSFITKKSVVNMEIKQFNEVTDSITNWTLRCPPPPPKKKN